MIPEIGKYWAWQRSNATRRDSDDRATSVVINTESVDRHGTIIAPEGGNLENYRENPVFLINHDEKLLAGTSDVKLQNNQWVATVKDDDWDNEDSEISRYKNKVVKRIMRMASVGILPTKMGEREVQENVSVPVIEEWDLLEWSFVTVGSNQDALIQNKRNFANDELLQRLNTLHNKLDQVINGEVKMSQSQIDSLIDAITDTQEPPKRQASANHNPAAAFPFDRSQIDEERLIRIANQVVEQKLGMK